MFKTNQNEKSLKIEALAREAYNFKLEKEREIHNLLDDFTDKEIILLYLSDIKSNYYISHCFAWDIIKPILVSRLRPKLKKIIKELK